MPCSAPQYYQPTSFLIPPQNTEDTHYFFPPHQCHRPRRPAELLHGNAVLQVAQPQAAILLRHCHACRKECKHTGGEYSEWAQGYTDTRDRFARLEGNGEWRLYLQRPGTREQHRRVWEHLPCRPKSPIARHRSMCCGKLFVRSMSAASGAITSCTNAVWWQVQE